ncbi:MAG: polysaccharide ABC transporter ATP-binding protein [Hormoscilla sp.]
MSDRVIQVENLGKKYIIGHQQSRHNTLRDAMSYGAKNISRHLRKYFSKNIPNPAREEFWALKDVSFEIKRGEVVGIIGRNGAGKSTLLKILSRITDPTRGRIDMKGRVASLLEVGTGFHGDLTGRENIFLNGAILGMSKKEIKNKFDEIVAFSEIEQFIDTPVKRYSSGMYVRLAFAVAAHLEPEILIVDEVLAVGDISFQKKCLGKIGEVRQGGRTVLFVSHNMDAVAKLCEKTIYLDKGEIVKIGLTPEVIKDYSQREVGNWDKSARVAERSVKDIECLNFYIKSVEIINREERKHNNEFKYGQSLALIVELGGQIEEGIFSLEFYIAHCGVIEQLVCMGSGDHHNRYFSKEVRKVKIEITPLTLSEGEYTMTLCLIYRKQKDYIAKIERLDEWKKAVGFQIVDCRPFGTDCVIRADYEQGFFVIGQSFAEYN